MRVLRPELHDRVEATLDEYEEVRADGATFMLTPGHEHADIERVVSDRGRFQVVEKMQRTVRETVAAQPARHRLASSPGRAR